MHLSALCVKGFSLLKARTVQVVIHALLYEQFGMRARSNADQQQRRTGPKFGFSDSQSLVDTMQLAGSDRNIIFAGEI